MIFGASRARRSGNTPRSREADAATTQELPPALLPSLRQVVSTATSLLHTRLSLAGVELEEELHRLILAAVFGFIALVLVLLALVVATFTIVAAVPIEYRVVTMIAITVVYLVIAAILAYRIKAIFSNRPALLSATLAELQKDKETISQMLRAYDAAQAAQEREKDAAERAEKDEAAQTRAARRAEKDEAAQTRAARRAARTVRGAI